MSTPTTQILENLFYFIYKNDSRFWTWSKYLNMNLILNQIFVVGFKKKIKLVR